MNKVTKLEPRFKDGDGGDEFDFAEHITIGTTENGYLVTVSFIDDVLQYVYLDADTMLKEIRKFL